MTYEEFRKTATQEQLIALAVVRSIQRWARKNYFYGNGYQPYGYDFNTWYASHTQIAKAYISAVRTVTGQPSFRAMPRP